MIRVRFYDPVFISPICNLFILSAKTSGCYLELVYSNVRTHVHLSYLDGYASS